MFSTVLLIVVMVLCTCFSCLAFCAAIFSLLTKGQIHEIGKKIFLISSLSVIVLAYASSPLITKGALTDNLKLDSGVELPTSSLSNDLVGSSEFALINSEFADRLTKSMPQIPMFIMSAKYEDTLKAEEKLIRDLLRGDSNNHFLVGALSIVVHERGGNGQSVIDRYYQGKDKKESRSLLLDILTKVYSGKPGAITEDDLYDLEGELWSSSWLLPKAVRVAYDRDPNNAELANMARLQSDRIKKEYSSWKERVIGFVCFSVILTLISPFAIFWILRRNNFRNSYLAKTDAAINMSNLTFIAVCILFLQVILAFVESFLVGFYMAFRIALINYGFRIPSLPEIEDPLVPFILLLVLIVLIFRQVCKPYGLSFLNDFMKEGKIDFWQSLQFVLCGFCIQEAFSNLILFFSNTIPGASLSWLHATELLAIKYVSYATIKNLTPIICWTVVICVLAPIAEELIFRGLIYRYLRKRFGVLAAISVSSLVFAVVHFNFDSAIYYFIIGVVLSVVFERTKNLYASICLHALFNFYMLVSIWMLIPWRV